MESAAQVFKGKVGSAAEWVNARTSDGLIDLNVIDWSKDDVVTNLKFTRARLSDASIRVNFVDCVFDRCEFYRVRTNGSFWGADDRWIDCVFDQVMFKDVISPNNEFTRCVFRTASLTQYVGVETLFEGCTFEHLRIDGFKAKASAARGRPFAKPNADSVVFRKCIFEKPSFTRCQFRHVLFDGCVVREPNVIECDFEGVSGTPAWWTGLPTANAFLSFLSEVLSRIEERLGTTSAAYHHFSDYVRRYQSGEITSKDYSKSLFHPDVSRAEMDALDDDLEELEAKYGI